MSEAATTGALPSGRAAAVTAAFAWGLIDGAVQAATPLQPGGVAAVARCGWCPLNASAEPAPDDDGSVEGEQQQHYASIGGPQGGGSGGATKSVLGRALSSLVRKQRQPQQQAAVGAAAAGALPPVLHGTAIGYDHAVALDLQGRVWARGWNVHGEADPAARAPFVDSWRAVSGLAAVAVAVVAAGERHSLALARDGRVFVWGQQCGRGDGATSFGGSVRGDGDSDGEEEDGGGGGGGGTDHRHHQQQHRHRQHHHHRVAHSPVTCVAGPGTLEAEPVAQIAAGGRHSLALTARSGVVLAWGANQLAQCGVDRGAAPVDVPSPRRVAPLVGVPIASIAAGAAHSVAVSRDGAAYAWGSGLDGALGAGLAGRRDCVLSRRGSIRRRQQQQQGLVSPTSSGPVSPRESIDGGGGAHSGGGGGGSSSGGPASPRPAAASGGGGGRVALVDGVECGDAGQGASSATPLLLEAPGLDDDDVVAAACGGRHTVLLTKGGAVWACGWNRYGQSCCCRHGGGGGGGAGMRGCPHGEAVYRPRRVRLPEVVGTCTAAAAASASSGGADRGGEGTSSGFGGGSGEVRAVQVVAGGWFTVVSVSAAAV